MIGILTSRVLRSEVCAPRCRPGRTRADLATIHRRKPGPAREPGRDRRQQSSRSTSRQTSEAPVTYQLFYVPLCLKTSINHQQASACSPVDDVLAHQIAAFRSTCTCIVMQLCNTDQLNCLLNCSRDDVLEELYRRLVEKRRKDETATSRPKSAAAGGRKRATSVDSEEPYLSDGVVDYG